MKEAVIPRLAEPFAECKSVVSKYQDFVLNRLSAVANQATSKIQQQKAIEMISLLKTTKTDDFACMKQILMSLGIDNQPTIETANAAKKTFSDFTDLGLRKFGDMISLSVVGDEPVQQGAQTVSCLVIKEWSSFPDYSDQCHGLLEALLRQAINHESDTLNAFRDRGGCPNGTWPAELAGGTPGMITGCQPDYMKEQLLKSGTYREYHYRRSQ
jgi:hypothetical protein